MGRTDEQSVNKPTSISLSFVSSLRTLSGFPGDSVSRDSACSAGDLDLIPRVGRSHGEGNGNPLQYPCLENSMDRGAWQATTCRVAKESDRTEQLSLMHSLRALTDIAPPQTPCDIPFPEWDECRSPLLHHDLSLSPLYP